MNQVSDRGVCLPEDINKIEEQMKSYSYIGSSDASHGILVPHDRPSSSEINTQSIAKLYVNSVEGEAELITYQRKKRQKKTDLSDLTTTDLGFLRHDAGSSSFGMDQRLESTSLDQPVEFESVLPCCSESISEKRVIADDGISMEVDDKKKSLEESSASSLGFQKTSINYDGTLIGKSDQTSENHNVDMLASNNLEELHDEAKETVSIVELHCLEFEEENIGNDPRFPSGDSVGGNTPLYHEEHSVASEANRSLKLLYGSKGVVSQVVHDESINVPVDRTFAGYTGKKLLVLDVNGLLVDISSYVPYDYDPDDIIMKKAVFKRPHCDDFLKFCFERFNVGVWTSRTKSNIEPILDFLLVNDKRKLLFCWDQSHCTNTGFTTVEKRHKPLLLKKLKKLWNKCNPDLPWERGVYNESNTLLLDDTPYKALSNPQYTAVFPYTYRFKDVGDNSLGPGGDLRVYLEGLAIADNVQEYVKQNPFGQRAITEKNLSWGYYRKVIAASSTPPRKPHEDDS